MRHYVAVQDAAGRWFYANEGRHRQTGEHGWTPTGACSPWDVCPTCDPWGFRGKAVPSAGCETCNGEGRVAKAEPCGGHDTAGGAYEHEKQRLLRTSVRFTEDLDDPKQLNRCHVEGCAVFTSGAAWFGSYQHWDLCPEHRTPDVVADLAFVGESWES